MKKSIFSVAVIAMLTIGIMGACNEKSAYPGYEKSTNGLYYQFFTQNAGAQPKIGELMEVILGCTVNDTAVVVPVTENIMQLMESQFPGDLFEGMAMMHKGDSASFIVNIDSTFKYLLGQPKLPEQYKSTDVMRFEIKLKDFYPESEYARRFAENVRKMNADRAALLQTDHPEETAKAAKELADYLAKNKVVAEPTASGLYYVMTQEGNGEKPEVGKPVKMHYTGKLLNGTVFDSSVERGEPFMFTLGVGQVIPGWDEGVQLMSKGEKGVLYIPYYLAYGDRPAGDKIPAFSNLMFEVELVDFEE